MGETSIFLKKKKAKKPHLAQCRTMLAAEDAPKEARVNSRMAL